MKKGFTLIELLVVVLIVAILTAIGLPQYNRVVQKARAAEAQSMMRDIYDSSERLAGEFGYRSYAKLLAANPSGDFGFSRLDLFDPSNLPAGCTITSNGAVLSCQKFDYRIYTNGYVAARTKLKPVGVLLLLQHGDLEMYCQGPEDACDIFGLDNPPSGVSF